MKCKLCGCEKIDIEYEGIIRNGGLGKYTEKPVVLYKCRNCHVIWHDTITNLEDYYQSDDYRISLEGTVEEEAFYALHDRETLDKLTYTNIIFRNKVVADIGCGCGAFLDVVAGMAKDVIAVEPTQTYREVLKRKKYYTYEYAKDALVKWNASVDIVVSFDVIEHVESPIDFMKDIFSMLKKGGQAIIGTPTDAPIMRKLLGDVYEKNLLFSTQHLWIFGKDNLENIARKVGFSADCINVKYFQRYGLENAFGWLKNKAPKSEIYNSMISNTMDNVWKNELEEQGLSDYIVLYLEK